MSGKTKRDTGKTGKHTRSQEEFLQAPETVQKLLKSVMREEREVAHMKRRRNIHQTLLEHVKRAVQ